MKATLLRISVVADGERVDLAVPSTLPVAELVPGLARRLRLVPCAGLRLHTPTGEVLADESGLLAQGVADGAVLVLAEPPPPLPWHDDVAEALADAAPADLPRPDPAVAVTLGAAAVLLALATVATLGADRPRGAGAVALMLLGTALAVGRSSPAAAVVAVTGAAGQAALATGPLVARLRPGPGVAWAAGGGAALALAATAALGLPVPLRHRLALLPVLVVASVATLVGAVLSLRAVPAGALACVLLAGAALAATALPWVAVGRIDRPRGRVDTARLADDVRVARTLLVGLGTGLGAVQVAAVPLVVGRGPTGVALAATTGALALLRARHLPVPDRWPGLVGGLAVVLVTSAAALLVTPAWRPPGAVVLAVGGALVLATPVARMPDLLAGVVLRIGELTCLLALPPLLLLATGALEHVP